MAQKLVEPPRTIHFHQSHSPNITVHATNPGIADHYTQSQARQILFSSRPLQPREKFTLKFLEASKTSKIIKIGFTSFDPSYINAAVTLNSNNFWTCSLSSSLFYENKTLFFYFSEKLIHYGIDDEEKGSLLRDLDTRYPLWGVVCFTDTPLSLQVINAGFQPLNFHQRRGRNVRLQGNRVFIGEQKSKTGYAFSGRPLQIGEWLVLKILKLRKLDTGKFTLGVTTCDPDTLELAQLPNNPIELIHKAKHTKIIQLAGLKFLKYEEISLNFIANGSMTIWKDGTLIKRVHLGPDFRRQFWGVFELGTAEGVELCSYFKDCDKIDSGNVIENSVKSPFENSADCVICCEKAVEVALYPCGHFCMCAECAKQQWRHGDGRCLMCRAVIVDVLRIYP